MKSNKYTYYLVAFFAFLTVLIYIYNWNTQPTDGATWVMEKDTAVVRMVQSGSAGDNAGLHIGDRILSIDGNHAELHFTHQMFYRYSAVGSTVEYRVLRDGAITTFPVTLESVWSTAPIYFISYYCLIIFILTVGLFVLLKKIENSTVRIFFIFTQLFGVGMIGSGTAFDTVGILAWSFFGFAMAYLGPTLFHFFLLFPERHRIIDRYPNLPKILYIASFILWCFGVTTPIYWSVYPSINSEKIAWVSFGIVVIWMGLNLIGAVILFVRRFFVSRESLNYNQLRWVMIGMLFGIVPHIILGIVPWLAWYMQELNPVVFHFFLGSGAFIFVSSTSLAILRFRMWDIEPIIKRGLLYTAMTGSIVGLYIALVYFVEQIVIVNSLPAHILEITVVALLFIPLRGILQRRIDRLFHREPYDSTEVVANFERITVGIYDEEKLHAVIFSFLDSIFHFTSFTCMKPMNDGSYRSLHHTGHSENINFINIFPTVELQDWLNRGKPFGFWELKDGIPGLNQIDAEIVVPRVYLNSVDGFFVCGRKRSARIYSREDIQLLGMLTKRAAALYHVVDLYENEQRAGREFSRQLIDSQEAERKRVAGELHDGLGQDLMVIVNRAQMGLKVTDAEKMKTQLDEITQTASRAIENVREIAYNLSPYHLDQLGLMESVKSMVEKIKEFSHIKFTTDIVTLNQVSDKKISINIYRIIQECLNNIVRHANATEVFLTAQQHEKLFVLTVRDNGRGFDVSSINNDSGTRKGFGLVSLSERVKLLSGTLDITSLPEAGTTVVIAIPYINSDK